MCKFQGKPVGEYCSCCQDCSLYLNTCIPIAIGGFVAGECDFDFCSYCPCYGDCENLWGKVVLNYDCRTLIMRNVRCAVREIPEAYTQAQYQILCRLIKQKGITKDFFHFLLMQLYNLSDWKQLDYRQMYELIHVLTYYDYEKENLNHE